VAGAMIAETAITRTCALNGLLGIDTRGEKLLAKDEGFDAIGYASLESSSTRDDRESNNSENRESRRSDAQSSMNYV
jgi:hypothetical protein